MSTRASDRIRSMFLPPDLDPAEEAARAREVAPGAEISGAILPSDLAMPEGLTPDWAPLVVSMREALAGSVAHVVADLLAENHPDPLQLFPEGIANAAGVARAEIMAVPVATEWEIAHLYALTEEAGPIDVAVFLGDPVSGARFDTLTAGAAAGGSRQYDRLKLRAGQRLVFTAAGLTAGNFLRVAVFGVIRSLRT